MDNKMKVQSITTTTNYTFNENYGISRKTYDAYVKEMLARDLADAIIKDMDELPIEFSDPIEFIGGSECQLKAYLIDIEYLIELERKASLWDEHCTILKYRG